MFVLEINDIDGVSICDEFSTASRNEIKSLNYLEFFGNVFFGYRDNEAY